MLLRLRSLLFRPVVFHIACAWALLLISASRILSGSRVLAATMVVREAVRQMLASPALVEQVAWFAVAQVSLHTIFGLCTWLIATATLRAFPQLLERRYWVHAATFLLAAFLVHLSSAAAFPQSSALPGVRLVAGLEIGPLALHELLQGALLSYLVLLAVRLLRDSGWGRAAARMSIWGTIALITYVVWRDMPRAVDVTAKSRGAPDVIVIGVDSLRTDVVGLSRSAGYAPAIQDFLEESNVFLDTTTPLARTFPAWITLLTGRSPVQTNARENLMPRSALRVPTTLADRFRAAGYRTFYATDEVRFANIDETYGFDVTITPRIGAADFALGHFNDLPLSNLVINTWVGRLLFPNSYANRAAATTYDPATFVEFVRGRLRPDTGKPTFLSLHLTLPHWPYRWAEHEHSIFSSTIDTSYRYLASVIAADRQFSAIMHLLEERGLLDNAIVVLLSDHGEALGFRSDNLMISREAKQEAGKVMVWMNGHGTSVLSPHQYQVVLAFRGFGRAAFPERFALHPTPAVSLEDVAPTLADLAGLEVETDAFEGLSLARTLNAERFKKSKSPPDDRIRFTETAYSTPSLRLGTFRAENAADGIEGGLFFGVERATGRFVADMSRWDELLGVKERAAIGKSWILAAVPAATPSGHKYLLVPKNGGLPKRLMAQPPAGFDNDEPIRLWSALHARFGDELGTPVGD